MKLLHELYESNRLESFRAEDRATLGSDLSADLDPESKGSPLEMNYGRKKY